MMYAIPGCSGNCGAEKRGSSILVTIEQFSRGGKLQARKSDFDKSDFLTEGQ